MPQPSRRNVLPMLVIGFSLLALPAGSGEALAEQAGAEGPDEDEVVLLGPVTRARVEESAPDWIEEEIAATPDVETVQDLLGAIGGSEVIVFMGTWCEDSRRELSRLWRGFDEAGALSPEEIRYIGVDRDKQEPRDLVTDQDLLFVPTIIVKRQGTEVGRIVEEAPAGIEFDLLALLTGEKSGVITARSDL